MILHATSSILHLDAKVGGGSSQLHVSRLHHFVVAQHSVFELHSAPAFVGQLHCHVPSALQVRF